MDDGTRFDLAMGMELAGTDVDDVWWRYASFGGIADRDRLEQWIAGGEACPATEQNRIAQAINEVFLDRGVTTFPVAYAPVTSTRTGSPMSVITTAIEVRQDARRAARRSAEIQRQAAALHSAAGRLMETSGALTYARQARRRAAAAGSRGASAATPSTSDAA